MIVSEQRFGRRRAPARDAASWMAARRSSPCNCHAHAWSAVVIAFDWRSATCRAGVHESIDAQGADNGFVPETMLRHSAGARPLRWEDDRAYVDAHATPDAPEHIDHARRCTRHDHRTRRRGSRGSMLSRHGKMFVIGLT